jgi:hypothetical protein
VAVKVTEVPSHTGFEEAVTVTLAAADELTFMVIALEVAGLPFTHPRFEVITQVIISAWTGA